MKTPLFFKLLLILAIGLRLIYAARKGKKITISPYYSLSDFTLKPLKAPQGLGPGLPPHEQLKYIYRKSVRGKRYTQTGTMVFLAIELEKSLKKGSLFRFIWHRNEWIYVFYQSLKILNFHSQSHLFLKAVKDLTGYNLERIAINRIKPEALFPEVQIDSEAWNDFEKSFSLQEFQIAVLKKITN